MKVWRSLAKAYGEAPHQQPKMSSSGQRITVPNDGLDHEPAFYYLLEELMKETYFNSVIGPRKLPLLFLAGAAVTALLLFVSCCFTRVAQVRRVRKPHPKQPSYTPDADEDPSISAVSVAVSVGAYRSDSESDDEGKGEQVSAEAQKRARKQCANV